MWIVGLVLIASAPSFILAGQKRGGERLNMYRAAAVVCVFGGGFVMGAGYKSATAGTIALVVTVIVLLAIIVVGSRRVVGQ